MKHFQRLRKLRTRLEVRTVTTTLDYLPFGTSDPDPSSRLQRCERPKNVTSRQIYKDIIGITWPSFVELALTQLTSMADQIMVGQLPGETGVMALSAVGLCTQPKFLLVTMLQALNVGATAMVARFRGRGEREKANTVFRLSFLLTLLLSILFMTSGLLFCEPLVQLIGGEGISAETYRFAYEYFRIQMIGFVPFCLTTNITAVLRGIGDSRTPLIYNTLANLVNLLFNYMLIYGNWGCPAMGVAGASWATIIGQTVAFVLAMTFVIDRNRYLYFSLREKIRFDRTILSNVITIGFPAMLEQVFMRTGVIIYTRTVTSLGDLAYATHIACMNISAMSFMTGQAFSTATTTLMGQSLGKKRYDMAEIYTRMTMRLAWICSIVLGLFLCLGGRFVVGLFNSTPEIMEMGTPIMVMLGIIQPIQNMQFVYAGGLRGAGDTKVPALVMLITVVGVRSLLAILFIQVLKTGLIGAWVAFCADQILRSSLMVLRYRLGKWRFIKLKGQS